MKICQTSCLLTMTCCCMLALPACATAFKVTKTDYPGATSTEPAAVNDAATVVGKAVVAGREIGYIESGTTFTQIKIPTATSVLPYAINQSGSIVGAYQTADSNLHGFMVTKNGKVRTLDFGNQKSTIARDINASGEIVGSYVDSNNNEQSFIDQAGQVTTLQPPNYQTSVAVALSSTGYVVGNYVATDNTQHTFLYRTGTYQEVSPPGTYGAFLSGVNASGEVIGYYPSPTGSSSYAGFSYQNDQYSTINFPNASDVFPIAIDDTGRIGGGATYDGYNQCFFLVKGSLIVFPSKPGKFECVPSAMNGHATIVGTSSTAPKTNGFTATCVGPLCK